MYSAVSIAANPVVAANPIAVAESAVRRQNLRMAPATNRANAEPDGSSSARISSQRTGSPSKGEVGEKRVEHFLRKAPPVALLGRVVDT